MHPCTAEDYAKFYPPDQRSKGTIERIRAAPNRDMLCLDWAEAGIDLFGTESSGTYSEIDIGVLPCNVRLTTLGATDDRISDTCVADLTKQIEYLGPMNILIYYNHEVF